VVSEEWREGLRLKDAMRELRYRAGAGVPVAEGGRFGWRCRRCGEEVVLREGEDAAEFARRVDWHVLGHLERL
jgi:hypothetical protein